MVAVTADRVVVELEARLDRYEANLRRAGQTFDRTTANIQRQATATERRVQNMASGIGAGIRNAISAIAITAAIGGVARYADSWTNARNQIAAAGVETEKLDTTLSRLADTANDTRSGFGATVSLYARLRRATEDLTASEAQRLRITELVNKAAIAGGASAQERESTVLQLGQGLASGALQGDELRSIRENAPLVARAIADEMNVTVGALKKLGEEGKITSDIIANAILGAGDKIDEQFSRTVPTIESSLQRLSTEYGRFQNSLDKSVGASQGVAAFVSHVADNMDLFAQAVLVAAAAVGGRFVGALVASQLAQDGMIGKAAASIKAIQEQSAAHVAAAQAAATEAQAQRVASAEAVTAIQARENALREEIVAYQQNIAMAEAQRAAAVKAAEASAAARALGVRTVGAGDLSGTGAGKAQQEQATKALIQNRRALAAAETQLAAVTGQLTVAQEANTAATARASVAAAAFQGAVARTSAVARVGALAVRGLSAALAFFGGPIGLAITAIAIAIGYIAGESAKAQAAADGLANTVADMASQAERAGVAIKDLTTDSADNANASAEAASQADQAAAAYERVRVAAINAGRAIQFMTAAERQSKLEELDEGLKGLSTTIRGGGIGDPFTTDQVERERNARTAYMRTFGTSRGRIADLAGSYNITPEQTAAAEQALRDGRGLTAVQQRLRQDYLNQQAVTRDLLNQERSARELREQLFQNINAPTLEEPEEERVTFQPGRTPPGSDAAGRRGRSAEELASKREELAVSAQIEALRIRGAEAEADVLSDRLDITQRIRAYEDAGLTNAQARAEAEEDVAAITAARAEAYAREQAIIRESSELERARAAGDIETVRSMERRITLRGLEEDYARSGLKLEEARVKAAEDLAIIEEGRRRANARELAAMSRSLELEIANTRQQYLAAQTLENAAYLQERIQAYRERDLGLVAATALATSDLLRLEQARVAAAQDVLSEQQASFELRLAEARLDEREANRLRREARIRDRSKELQSNRVPEDQADRRARYEVLSEEMAQVQGQFRDAVRGGFRAALEGDVMPWLEEQLNRIAEQMFDRAADSIADVLFNAAKELLPSLFPDPGEVVDVAVTTAEDAARNAATSLAITTAHATGATTLSLAITSSALTGATAMGTAITAAGTAAAAQMAAAIAGANAGKEAANIGSTIASAFAGGGKAGGGRVNRGAVYPVGENGPELFAPDSSGVIIPNGRLGGRQQAVFQSTFAPVIDARGADAVALARVEAQLRRMQKTEQARVTNIVNRGLATDQIGEPIYK